MQGNGFLIMLVSHAVITTTEEDFLVWHAVIKHFCRGRHKRNSGKNRVSLMFVELFSHLYNFRVYIWKHFVILCAEIGAVTR